jgi:hypothetical protein
LNICGPHFAHSAWCCLKPAESEEAVPELVVMPFISVPFLSHGYATAHVNFNARRNMTLKFQETLNRLLLFIIVYETNCEIIALMAISRPSMS